MHLFENARDPETKPRNGSFRPQNFDLGIIPTLCGRKAPLAGLVFGSRAFELPYSMDLINPARNSLLSGFLKSIFSEMHLSEKACVPKTKLRHGSFRAFTFGLGVIPTVNARKAP